MTSIATHRTEPLFPRTLFTEQTLFALMVWAGFALFIFVLTFAVSLVRGIEASGWNLAGGPARWFGFAIGIYVGYTLFPLHVTHGGTRKGFWRQAALFTLAYGAVLGVLFTLAFPVEAGIYTLAGWPQDLHQPQLYAYALDLPMVLLQWVLIMVLWVTAGLAIGASWYRHAALGALSIVIGIFLAGVSGVAISADSGPHLWVYQQLFGAEKPGTAMAIVLHLAAIAIALGLSWLAFKDAPIHNTSK